MTERDSGRPASPERWAQHDLEKSAVQSQREQGNIS